MARALVNRPSLLLCDEPTGNLDTTSTEELTNLLSVLHDQGATLVVITHNPVVAARAQRLIRIQDGGCRTCRKIPACTPANGTGARMRSRAASHGR